MVEKQFKAGEVVFHQGDKAESFYRILDGTAEVIVNYGMQGERRLAELGKDAYFGEMAVIEAYPRSATVTAGEKGLKAEEIPAEDLNKYVDGVPDQFAKILMQLGDRLRELTKDYNDAEGMLKNLQEQGQEPKQQEHSEGFFKRLRKHTAFYKANKNFTEKSAEEMREERQVNCAEGYSAKIEKYPEGTVIFKEGETGTCMYGIHWGKVGIYSDFGTPREQKLTELTANSFFGEMGMVSREPRSATAIALVKDTVVEIITEKDLNELYKKNPPKASMILAHLSSRLRKLTRSYVDVCEKLYEAVEDGSV